MSLISEGDLLPQDQMFRLQLCSRLEERSQYAENQLEQILHQVANLPRLVSGCMLNRIFGTHRLKPFTSTRRDESGDVLFRKGDDADAMFFVVSGRYRLAELGMDILSGQVVGELGLLAPDESRTQTLECIEDGEVLQITYEQVKQLYLQNPRFGFYFLQLTTRRLFENIASLERELAACKVASASPREVGASLSPS